MAVIIYKYSKAAGSYHSVSAHCRLLAVWSACETLALPPSCLHLEKAGSLGQGRGGRGLGYVERCQSLPLLPGLQFRFQRLGLKCHGGRGIGNLTAPALENKAPGFGSLDTTLGRRADKAETVQALWAFLGWEGT